MLAIRCDSGAASICAHSRRRLLAPILGSEHAAAIPRRRHARLHRAAHRRTGRASGMRSKTSSDSDDLEDFLVNSLDLVGLPIDGAVNGGGSDPTCSRYRPILPPTSRLATQSSDAASGPRLASTLRD